jgi:nitrogen fixation protein
MVAPYRGEGSMNFRTQLGILAISSLSICLGQQPALAGDEVVVTVGSDSACDFTSITAASFNAPDANLLTIRLAKNVSTSGTQLISARNTAVAGGFDTCSDTTPSGSSVLDGGGFNGAIMLGVNSGSLTIDLFLENIEITGGNSNTSGGGISLEGPWRLVLAGANINNNLSNGNGGGIYIEDTNARLAKGFGAPRSSLEIYESSIISSNTANDGGGIACAGSVRIETYNSQIGVNEATSDGGGVYLTDGCEFELYDSGPFQGVVLNEAAGFGGGIFAGTNTVVRLRGGDSGGAPAVVVSNSATNGGGIALRSGAVLDARDSVISDNTASNTGGGIRSDGGEVHVYRSRPGSQCHSEARCSRLNGNTANGADAGFAGGGAILAVGGTIRITGTYIEDNWAHHGSAIRARFIPLDGFDRNINIIGNIFATNENAPQVIYLDESDADMGFNTFVNNTGNSRIIEIAYPDTPTEPHGVRIFGSIFDQAGGTVPSAELTTSGAFPTGDCNRNEPSSSGDLAGEPRSTTTTPSFVNAGAGDYRLSPGSALVDYCDWSTLGSESNFSANGLSRPNDLSQPNQFGAYDLGGIERHEPGDIFRDRFEN